jgi:hypothetical protein
MSMSSEHSHFAMLGSSLHDITGPISVPRVGPTLLTQLSDIVIALTWSMPNAIITVEANKHIITNTAKNDSSV